MGVMLALALALIASTARAASVEDYRLRGFKVGGVFEMQLDEMPVFESAKGCHLVRVVEIDDPEDPPFERIREFLRPKLEAQEERRLLESFLETLSGEATILLTPRDSPTD